MKTKIYYPVMLATAILFAFSSCKKDASSTSTTTTSKLTTTASSGVIAISAAVSDSTTSTDSIYLVNCFGPRSKPDSVAFSSLPAAIGTYLTANYSGYTFDKAFKIDSAGSTKGYIVVIKYNNAPIGLKFTATGVFVEILEQQDGPDMHGKGGHPGDPFGDRMRPTKDTIALSALPSVVKTYFTTNYPTDTLLHASVTHDTTYILISKNKGLFATAISKTGTLVNRMELQKPGPRPVPIAAASLPAAVTSYLTTTYPGYVFNNAFSESSNGTIIGYDVLITVNSTNYDVRFDGSGAFVKAITLH